MGKTQTALGNQQSRQESSWDLDTNGNEPEKSCLPHWVAPQECADWGLQPQELPDSIFIIFLRD